MNVRKHAFDVLCQVLIKGQYSNLALRKIDNLNEKDQALLSEIVYGTIQNYDYLTYQWQRFVKKMPKKEVRCLLNMSIYQLLFLDKIPDYAVLDEAIMIAKAFNKGSYKGLCNAVLRQFIKEREIVVELDDPEQSMAIKTSHPLWLIKMWSSHYDQATAFAICEYDNKRKATALRINTSMINKQSIFDDERFHRGKLAESAVYYDGNIFNTHYFKKHLVSVQDEASQYVSIFADPKKDDRILDMCSAPGTKAAHMAMITNDQGHIDAIDIYKHRVDLIITTCENLNLKSVHTHVLDALEVTDHLRPASYDLVLLDAPCSGLGVLSHKPEIKLRIRPEDIDELVELQKRLLDKASQMVKTKGRIVYSTCTINKKENEKQIESFLSLNSDFILIDEKMILPMEYDTDGFYMAKLQRIG